MRMTPERIDAAHDILEEQRKAGSRGAGSRAAVLAAALKDTLDDLTDLQRVNDRAEYLLVELLELMAHRKNKMEFLARMREPHTLRNVGKHFEARGKLDQIRGHLETIEGDPS